MLPTSMKCLASRSFVRSFEKCLNIRNYSAIAPAVDKSKAPSVKTKSKKNPFILNTFLGQFDLDFLSYPEILNDEDINDIASKTASVLDSIAQNDNTNRNSSFTKLLSSGILKLQSPEEHGGVDVKSTYLLKTSEMLGFSPPDAMLLEVQRSLVIQTLLKYGSKSQKDKYLSRLLNGEIIGAYAIAEETSGSDPSTMRTTALFDDNTKCYKIAGEKTWVSNGCHADLLILFTKLEEGNHNSIDLGAFIIETNTEGISIEKHAPAGLEDCGLSRIKFDDVEIPEENLIGDPGDGNELATFSLGSHHSITSSCILNSLKNIFQESISYIKERKQHMRDLKDCHQIQDRLARVGMTIYSMESMMYLISGVSDRYEIDTSLESAIIQVFGSEQCLEAYNYCLSLLGGRSYDTNYPFAKQLTDLKGLTLMNKTTDVIKLYIGITGLKYSGLKKNEEVGKMRNPLNFPGFVVRKMISNSKQRSDNPSLALGLFTELHPSLKDMANLLEYCVLRLDYAVDSLFVRYGSSVVDYQLELLRLADVAVRILSMTSVLARASRSYCTGIKYSDDEVSLARGICFDSHKFVKNALTNLLEGPLESNDFTRLKIGNKMIQHGNYFLEHPTIRNIK